MTDVGVVDVTTAAVTAPETVDDLIEAVRTILLSNQREQLNRLEVGMTAEDSSLRTTYELNEVSRGSQVAIDLEVMHVWLAQAGNSEVIVERGFQGSQAAAHSAGSIVFVNPRYSKWQIYRALNAELDLLEGEGIYRMESVDLTYLAGIRGYDLSGVDDLLSVYKVVRQAEGPEKYWPEVRHWSYDSNFTAAQFPSTRALFVGRERLAGQPLRVFYRAGFNHLGLDLSDNVTETTGLPREAHQILIWGAAGRLAIPQDVRRTDLNSQGDSRRAADVPPGSPGRAGMTLLQLREQAIRAEANRLAQLWPSREHL